MVTFVWGAGVDGGRDPEPEGAALREAVHRDRELLGDFEGDGGPVGSGCIGRQDEREIFHFVKEGSLPATGWSSARSFTSS